MTLRIDITSVPPERLRFAASPLAELTAMLHVLASPEHHPQLAAWAAGVRAALRPELAERLQEAEFLWRSSRADFLLPAAPRATLAAELDDVDGLDDDAYVTSALVTTCGSNRLLFAGPSPLADDAARERALDRAQARARSRRRSPNVSWRTRPPSGRGCARRSSSAARRSSTPPGRASRRNWRRTSGSRPTSGPGTGSARF